METIMPGLLDFFAGNPDIEYQYIKGKPGDPNNYIPMMRPLNVHEDMIPDYLPKGKKAMSFYQGLMDRLRDVNLGHSQLISRNGKNIGYSTGGPFRETDFSRYTPDTQYGNLELDPKYIEQANAFLENLYENDPEEWSYSLGRLQCQDWNRIVVDIANSIAKSERERKNVCNHQNGNYGEFYGGTYWDGNGN